jgi:hypothetical protein
MDSAITFGSLQRLLGINKSGTLWSTCAVRARFLGGDCISQRTNSCNAVASGSPAGAN